MFRFSLTVFLMSIAVAAVLACGLAHPTGFWRQIIATMVLAVLLAGTIAAIVWRQPGRWFWLGFVLVGWSYLILGYFGGYKTKNAFIFHSAVVKVDRLLETSQPHLDPGGQVVALHDDGVRLGILDGPGLAWTSEMSRDRAEKRGYLVHAYSSLETVPAAEHFYSIGHYIWVLLLGTLGGMFSFWLHRKNVAADGKPVKST